MDKIKVRSFVTAYAEAIELSDESKSILLELMENIITKYEKEIPPIPVSLDPSTAYPIKPINGYYSVEDFFLNRLMRNIWSVSEITPQHIKEGFADIHTKGQFDPFLQVVEINTAKKKQQLEKYKMHIHGNYEELSEKAFKKLIMHEFEHGLQTVYPNDLDMQQRGNYKKIIDRIKKIAKYSKNVRSYEEIPKELGTRNKHISCGALYSSHAEKLGIKTYRHVKDSHNLNEILNETESLEMSSYNAGLYRVFRSSGNYFQLRNPESSNSEITNYAFLIKNLLGSTKTFTLMYLNPSKIYTYFNETYGEIFQEMYESDKDGIEILMECLTDIKHTKDESAHLKLTAALTKCMEKKVLMHIDDPSISSDKIIASLKKFESYCMTNDNPDKRTQLEHIRILESIKESVKNREKSSKKETTDKKEVLPIPSFEEVKNLAKKYELKVDEDSSKISVVNRETQERIADPNIVPLALFANIWLSSAGIKKDFRNIVPGEEYAFNEGAKRTYDFFVDSMITSLEETGNVNTIDMFKNAEILSYKHSQEIIVSLFRTDYQSKFLTDFFRKRCNVANNNPTVQPLYNMPYAGSLAYQEEASSISENKCIPKHSV